VTDQTEKRRRRMVSMKRRSDVEVVITMLLVEAPFLSWEEWWVWPL